MNAVYQGTENHPGGPRLELLFVPCDFEEHSHILAPEEVNRDTDKAQG